jgi:hypothetical protein
MPDLFPVSLADMIREVERELKMRRNLYPTWKQNAGIVKRNQLDRQYAVLEAVLTKLEEERDGVAEQHEAQ